MSQSPSRLDDEKFQVAKAAKLTRQGLLELQMEITLDRDVLESSMRLSEDGRYYAEEAHLRKGRQVQWISIQLAKLREKSRAANKVDPKLAKRRSFHEHFFLICRRELEPYDFKELCAEAQYKAGSGPLEIVQEEETLPTTD